MDEIRSEYLEFIEILLTYQDVIVLVHPDDGNAASSLPAHSRLHRAAIPFDDTWCRDYGPISTVSVDGRTQALDFRFNAWGGRYGATLDNAVNDQLLAHALLEDFECKSIDFELEGGAIDSDGAGSVLVNWYCLETRHPGQSRDDLAENLKAMLFAERILGIDLPALPGDDTDGHIDTLARFIDPDTLVFQSASDLNRNTVLRQQLVSMRTAGGKSYRLIALPAVDGFDPALPANYANFLIINGACLVPAYGVPSDHEAQQVLRRLMPARKIVPISAKTMITQFGGPHCATMNIPEPVVCPER